MSWALTLSLVFGGCCANAISLEQLTSQYPFSGSLITFIQFLLISLHGLPKHTQFIPATRWRIPIPQLKPRRIPITPYLIQVTLFYLISLLNNAAFGYQIPMSVHIIFRSGGLIVSMLLGWMIAGRRYTITQIVSVILVTLGVVLSTLSASKPDANPKIYTNTTSYTTYATGIATLSFALLLSGFLGMVQDKTYATYGQPQASNSNSTQHTTASDVPPWQESMFYLHFLALPLFFLVRNDLFDQFQSVNSGPRIHIAVPRVVAPFIPHTSLSLPRTVLPLLFNTVTQLVCVTGVHRLTTRVSSLTVTLILVVRKAVSFVMSVLWLKGGGGGPVMMWVSAGLVMLGTIGYSIGSARRARMAVKERKSKQH